jgi:DNA-binding NarL/FixJ family response regulator
MPGDSTTTAPINIFVADDHPVVTAGMTALLSSLSGLRVVGQASNGAALEQGLAGAAVDVLLLDLNMPGVQGADTVRRLRAAYPRLRIAILTANADPATAKVLLAAGATGYILKNDEGDDLLRALDEVSAGRGYVSHSLALERRDDGRLVSLTPRERQMLAMIGDGRSNAEIASALGISLATARKHRENLRRKLDAHSGAQLAALAVASGLSQQPL